MSRKDAEYEGFLRGLATAQRAALEAEKDGERVSDTLKKMIKMRRSTGVTLPITPREMAAATETMKANTIHTVLAMTLLILYEQNGWGAKRLNRFIDEFNTHTQALMEGSIDWNDVVECLESAAKVSLNFPEDMRQQKIMNT